MSLYFVPSLYIEFRESVFIFVWKDFSFEDRALQLAGKSRFGGELILQNLFDTLSRTTSSANIHHWENLDLNLNLGESGSHKINLILFYRALPVLENGKRINANIIYIFESLLQATNENMSLQHLFATS